MYSKKHRRSLAAASSSAGAGGGEARDHGEDSYGFADEFDDYYAEGEDGFYDEYYDEEDDGGWFGLSSSHSTSSSSQESLDLILRMSDLLDGDGWGGYLLSRLAGWMHATGGGEWLLDYLADDLLGGGLYFEGDDGSHAVIDDSLVESDLADGAHLKNDLNVESDATVIDDGGGSLGGRSTDITLRDVAHVIVRRVRSALSALSPSSSPSSPSSAAASALGARRATPSSSVRPAREALSSEHVEMGERALDEDILAVAALTAIAVAVGGLLVFRRLRR